MPLLRNPDLLIAWCGDRLIIKDLRSGRTARADMDVLALLDVFSKPRSVASAIEAMRGYRPKTVRRAVTVLRRKGLLVEEAEARPRLSRLQAWKRNFASAFYHVASRDIRYIQDPAESEAFLRVRLAEEKRPAPFKRHRAAPATALPAGGAHTSADAKALGRVLLARRTVRQFQRRTVTFEDLAEVVRGTWGQSGWLEAGVLGRLPTRTSPSAGGLHPIECYVLAWNVRGLRAGIYHYDVAGDDLRLLQPRSPRAAAVRAASGQRWVGDAAFLCVMTAVFERTLWKYELENAYRTLWYEAGHLGQTFVLLATAHGLGAFTTAAMQDSFIERLLGLDGVRDFPIYLCGAGVPDPGRRFPPWVPLEPALRSD